MILFSPKIHPAAHNKVNGCHAVLPKLMKTDEFKNKMLICFFLPIWENKHTSGALSTVALGKEYSVRPWSNAVTLTCWGATMGSSDEQDGSIRWGKKTPLKAKPSCSLSLSPFTVTPIPLHCWVNASVWLLHRSSGQRRCSCGGAVLSVRLRLCGWGIFWRRDTDRLWTGAAGHLHFWVSLSLVSLQGSRTTHTNVIRAQTVRETDLKTKSLCKGSHHYVTHQPLL